MESLSIDVVIESLESKDYIPEIVQYLEDRRKQVEEEIKKLEQAGRDIRYKIGKSTALRDLKMKNPNITEDEESTNDLLRILSDITTQIANYKPELYAIEWVLNRRKKQLP